MLDAQRTTIMIVGASGSLGQSLVKALASPTTDFVLLGQNHQRLEAADDRNQEGGGAPAMLVPADMTRDGIWPELMAHVRQRYQRLDVIIWAAGVMSALMPVSDISMRQWQTSLTINALAMGRMLQAAQGLLLQQKSLMLYASDARLNEQSEHPYLAGYLLTKQLAEGILESFAGGLPQGSGLTVQSVRLPLMRTPMTAAIYPGGVPQSAVASDEVAAGLADYVRGFLRA